MMFTFAEDDENEKEGLSDGALDEVLEEESDDDEDDFGVAPEGEEEGRDWA